MLMSGLCWRFIRHAQTVCLIKLSKVRIVMRMMLSCVIGFGLPRVSFWGSSNNNTCVAAIQFRCCLLYVQSVRVPFNHCQALCLAVIKTGFSFVFVECEHVYCAVLFSNVLLLFKNDIVLIIRCLPTGTNTYEINDQFVLLFKPFLKIQLRLDQGTEKTILIQSFL